MAHSREKYRDFIEVADRINLMNGLAKGITDRIQNISSSLTNLDLNLEDDRISKIDARSKQYVGFGCKKILSNIELLQMVVFSLGITKPKPRTQSLF